MPVATAAPNAKGIAIDMAEIVVETLAFRRNKPRSISIPMRKRKRVNPIFATSAR